jgi:hypothetical protein
VSVLESASSPVGEAAAGGAWHRTPELPLTTLRDGWLGWLGQVEAYTAAAMAGECMRETECVPPVVVPAVELVQHGDLAS